MGTFLAKLKNNSDQLFKMADGVRYRDFDDIILDDAMIYDVDNNINNQWFKKQQFNEEPSFWPLLDQELIVAELNDISRNDYNNIEVLVYFHDQKFYFQKVTSGNYLKKKWFSFDGAIVSYHSDDDKIMSINHLPNCIYSQVTKDLYFATIDKAYQIFPCLKEGFLDDTESKIKDFLQSDLLEIQDFSVKDVGIENRKKIRRILDTYNQYNQEQKDKLRGYIHTFAKKALPFSEENGKFTISNEKQLRLFLYGLQERFYQPPLNAETKVATSTTSIQNIM